MTDNEDVWVSRGQRLSDSFTRHPFWTSIKIGIPTLAVIFCLWIAGEAIATGGVFWEAAKAKITAQPRVTKNIYETENIIQKIALFHEKCTAFNKDLLVFQNNYQRYVADKESLKGLSGLERTSVQSTLPNDISDYTAALNVAQEDSANYNSASANPTISPFKTIFSQHGLPNRIELPSGASAAYSFHINCG